MTIKIFISYSWKNSSDRTAIAKSLGEIKDIEVYYDKSHIKKGKNIHSEISDILDKSHIVIALLTGSSVTSVEVRDELVRANERGLIILPIVDADVKDVDIPFFLRDVNQIRYLPDQFDSVLDAVVIAIQKLRVEIWKPSIAKCTRNIFKHLDRFDDLPAFRKDLAQDLLQEADKEILAVTQNYSLDIGVQRNYLTRAKPIFKYARAIYAVSIASVSTFWSDSRNYNLAKNYLDSQKLNVHRLFVFDNADEANNFKNILQANHLQYGTAGGGVFICSKSTYLNFLQGICFQELSQDELYSQDFAYLNYDHNGSHYWLMAQLDTTYLQFKRMDNEYAGASTDILGLTEQFHSLATLDLGSFDNRKILRWHPDLVWDHNNWSKKLSVLFEEKKGAVYHFVFFKHVRRELEQSIYNLKNEIHKLARYHNANFLLNKIWLGKIIDLPATDEMGIELSISKNYEYVLLIELPCYEDLKNYYSFSDHTSARQKFYSMLDSNIGYLYREKEKLDDEKSKNSSFKRELETISHNIKIILSIIEKLASQYIVRMDFIDEGKNDSIAAQPGLPFGSLKY